MVASETKMTRAYHQEDIQQILQLAIARQDHQGEALSYAQLVEIATELGISAEHLQAAEQEWLVRQDQWQEQRAFNAYRQSKLQQHFGKYIITNSFLVPLNLAMTDHLSWSLYILLGWGLGLSLNAWKTYQAQGDEYEKAFQIWRRKHQLSHSINTFLDKWLKPYSVN